MAQHDKKMIVAVLKFMLLWLSNLRKHLEYEEFNFH